MALTILVPSDIDAKKNGQIDVGTLAGCGVFSSYRPFGELKMHHLAAQAMKAMVARMAPETDVAAVNGTGTYRSLERQIQMFDGTNPASRTSTEGRYIPQSLWGTFGSGALDADDERRWKEQRWRRRKGTAEASVPGKSNHGLGLAIDFDNGQIDSYLHWLRANAGDFGFDEENSSERWHWRYHAGDSLPAAVTQTGPEPPPIDPLIINPPLEEDNMRIVDVNFDTGGFARVVVSDHVRWVRGPALTAFDKLAIPKFEIEPLELIGLMETLGTAGPSPFSGAFGNALPNEALDQAWNNALR